MSVLTTIADTLKAIESNPVVAQYAEPVAIALITGSSTIAIPEGTINITQNAQPSKFTIPQALVAIETFVLTGETSITIGTTVISFVPKAA